MVGVNKVILLNSLGKYQKIKYTPEDMYVTNFFVATSEE